MDRIFFDRLTNGMFTDGRIRLDVDFWHRDTGDTLTWTPAWEDVCRLVEAACLVEGENDPASSHKVSLQAARGKARDVTERKKSAGQARLALRCLGLRFAARALSVTANQETLDESLENVGGLAAAMTDTLTTVIGDGAMSLRWCHECDWHLPEPDRCCDQCSYGLDPH